MNHQKTIAFDFDDTLYDSVGLFLAFNQKVFGGTATYQDIGEGPFHEYLGITEEEENKRWDLFFSDPRFWDEQPHPKTIATLQDLKSRHNLVVLTARSHPWQDQVKAWVAKHLPDIFEEILFADSPEFNNRRKVFICGEKNISCLIDDNLEQITSCLECSDPKVEIIVFDRPWNRQVPPSVPRVSSIGNVLEKDLLA
jgi:uncharacterized HAD superfamily protein